MWHLLILAEHTRPSALLHNVIESIAVRIAPPASDSAPYAARSRRERWTFHRHTRRLFVCAKLKPVAQDAPGSIWISKAMDSSSSTQHPDVKELLVTHRPVRSNGRPKKTDTETSDNVRRFPVSKEGTNCRAYIEQRLSRDFKDIWKAYLAGEYPSARQAGIAAGFIKDGHDALMRLKSNWNKATKSQKKEFRKWIDAQTK